MKTSVCGTNTEKQQRCHSVQAVQVKQLTWQNVLIDIEHAPMLMKDYVVINVVVCKRKELNAILIKEYLTSWLLPRVQL